MGVEGALTNIINNIIPIKKYTKNNGNNKYVIIDARSLIYRYSIGSLNTFKFIIDKNGDKVIEVYYLLMIALRFLSDDIIPIFVFDGKSPDIKNNTINKRKCIKDKAIKKITDETKEDNINDEINTVTDININTVIDNVIDIDNTNIINDTIKDNDVDDEMPIKKMSDQDYLKYLKRSYKIKSKNIEKGKMLLQWMGIPIVDALGEADSQCSAIASVYSDSVIGIITDDFDPLVYMSKNILKMSSINSNYLEEYTLENIVKNMGKSMVEFIDKVDDDTLNKKYSNKKVKFTQLHFMEICIMMGTDYCPGLKLNKAPIKFPTINGQKLSKYEQILYLYLCNNMSLKDSLTSLTGFLSDNYINRMLNAKNEYINANVYDPNDIDITFNKPVNEMVKSICSEFLDKDDVEYILKLLDKTYGKFINEPNNNNNNMKQNNLPQPAYYQDIIE